jgi:hypothetical protein
MGDLAHRISRLLGDLRHPGNEPVRVTGGGVTVRGQEANRSLFPPQPSPSQLSSSSLTLTCEGGARVIRYLNLSLVSQ